MNVSFLAQMIDELSEMLLTYRLRQAVEFGDLEVYRGCSPIVLAGWGDFAKLLFDKK